MIFYPQRRSLTQEVDSSASQFHSLQPGMWNVLVENILPIFVTIFLPFRFLGQPGLV